VGHSLNEPEIPSRSRIGECASYRGKADGGREATSRSEIAYTHKRTGVGERDDCYEFLATGRKAYSLAMSFSRLTRFSETDRDTNPKRLLLDDVGDVESRVPLAASEDPKFFWLSQDGTWSESF